MNIELYGLCKMAIDKAIEYIKEDQSKQYPLNETRSLTIEGDGVGRFNFSSQYFDIVKNSNNSTTLVARPFAAETGLWNGPDILPDNLPDGTFQASLFHDLIWGMSKDIAATNNATESDVEIWGNGIMIAIMKKYAKREGGCKLWQRIVYNTLHYGRIVYRPAKNLLKRIGVLCAVLFLGGCTSCLTPPDWNVSDASCEILLTEGR